MDDILERLKKFKLEEDISYKEVAQDIDIPLSALYNFTSGARDLKPKRKRLLNQYLTEKGY